MPPVLTTPAVVPVGKFNIGVVDTSGAPHCNDNSVYIFLFWDSAATAPISTFTCLWAIYIFPGSAYIFPPAEPADPSWEYIIRSQTHECGNWDWGPNIPFLGIFVFVFAVLELQISLRIYKNLNDPNIIFRSMGEDDSWKKPEAKISWHCPFNPTVHKYVLEGYYIGSFIGVGF